MNNTTQSQNKSTLPDNYDILKRVFHAIPRTNGFSFTHEPHSNTLEKMQKVLNNNCTCSICKGGLCSKALSKMQNAQTNYCVCSMCKNGLCSTALQKMRDSLNNTCDCSICIGGICLKALKRIRDEQPTTKEQTIQTENTDEPVCKKTNTN